MGSGLRLERHSATSAGELRKRAALAHPRPVKAGKAQPESWWAAKRKAPQKCGAGKRDLPGSPQSHCAAKPAEVLTKPELPVSGLWSQCVRSSSNSAV